MSLYGLGLPPPTHPPPPYSVQSFPPGWECSLDPRSGRIYFINHFGRFTTWDDPRTKYGFVSPVPYALQQEQGTYGQYRMFPGYASRLYGGPSPQSGSPLLTGVDEKLMRRLQTYCPVIPEEDLREALKKYNNNENEVLTYLSSKGYPVFRRGGRAGSPRAPSTNPHQGSPLSSSTGTTGSSSGTPQPTPPPRFQGIAGAVGVLQGSPAIRPVVAQPRRSPSRGDSPMMKLRYLKNIFPAADEMVILETLMSCDSNAQEASEKLVEMGYERQDLSLRSRSASTIKSDEEKAKKEEKPQPTAKKSSRKLLEKEKKQVRSKLAEEYKDLPVHVLGMALDSVNYDEEKAHVLLKRILSESSSEPTKVLLLHSPVAPRDTSTDGTFDSSSTETETVSQVDDTVKEMGFKSTYRLQISGPDPLNRRGPSRDLCSEEHVQTQGPNPSNRKGPDPTFSKRTPSPLSTSSSIASSLARGPQSALRRGPRQGLACGSIYSLCGSLMSSSASTSSRLGLVASSFV